MFVRQSTYDAVVAENREQRALIAKLAGERNRLRRDLLVFTGPRQRNERGHFVKQVRA